MQIFFDKIKPWISTIILILLGLFAVIRMQVTQAQIVRQLNNKVDKSVYDVAESYQKREFDHLRDQLNRIEAKIDRLYNED